MLIHSVNSLASFDAVWRRWNWSTLSRVMACCLTARSHYLNKCWLVIKSILWQSPLTNFAKYALEINPRHVFRYYTLKNYHHIALAQTSFTPIYQVVTNSRLLILPLDVTKYIAISQYVLKPHKWFRKAAILHIYARNIRCRWHEVYHSHWTSKQS